ncbi:glycosyltransferase family 39 protein [Micromonospora sp. NPDC049523]|uniref:glycosyltransferase family 39 protein n=1 Tax=Micromonospora sp. NPDC049523 TaxID=3155921 RepID=UPI0034490C7A
MVVGTVAQPAESEAAYDRRQRLALPVAVAFGLAGVVYRLVLLLHEVPPANSDEATSGLVAMHVAQGREFPLFFYGQHYMGALESYLAAPLFAVFGPSTLALRLPNLLLYAAFLALAWQLARRLYTPWLATVTVGLLAFGSDRVLKNQLVTAGGYPEMNPAGVLLALLAVNLGLARWAGRRRLVAYAGFGLVAGLTLWDDWLVLPYVGAAGLLLLVVGRRELTGRAGLALGGGLLVGLVPIVAHNLTAAPENRSLASYTTLGGEPGASWPDRLHGGILFGLPMGTGFCAPGRCAPWQLWWGVAGPILLVVAGVLAVGALRAASGVERVRQGGRLVLVVGAALSLIAYATSSVAANTRVESARYLSCLLISFPALLWPLWSAATAASRSRRPTVWSHRPTAWSHRPTAWSHRPAPEPGERVSWAGQVRRAGWLPWPARGLLAALAASLAVATGQLVTRVPELGRVADQRRELVAALDRLGVNRFYGEYWTCNDITFQTRERLVCAVIRDDLRAGWDRYPPYREAVGRAGRPAYVLPAGTALSAAVAAYLAGTGVPVSSTSVAGYDIYHPATRVDLPRR